VSRSMKSHQPQASLVTSWVTPQWILDPLGKFDLDPCTPTEGMPWPTAKRMIRPDEDGLAIGWMGKVWLNPPFDKPSRSAFLERMARHDCGIALVPASTETDWFKKWIWPYASSILFLNRRPYFHYPDGRKGPANSGCSICLVSYRMDEVLRKSGLGEWLPIGACEWKGVARKAATPETDTAQDESRKQSPRTPQDENKGAAE
jgi:hypothetical protein